MTQSAALERLADELSAISQTCVDCANSEHADVVGHADAVGAGRAYQVCAGKVRAILAAPPSVTAGEDDAMRKDLATCVQAIAREDAAYASGTGAEIAAAVMALFESTKDFIRTHHVALEAPLAAAPKADTLPAGVTEAMLRGTFNCPICGQGTPHHHSDDVVTAYRDDQIRRDGWISSMLGGPKVSGWYLCKGVEVASDQRDHVESEASQLSWFLWVRAAAPADADTPEVLYWDRLLRQWFLRNMLGNAVPSGEDIRWRVVAKPRFWRTTDMRAALQAAGISGDVPEAVKQVVRAFVQRYGSTVAKDRNGEWEYADDDTCHALGGRVTFRTVREALAIIEGRQP